VLRNLKGIDFALYEGVMVEIYHKGNFDMTHMNLSDDQSLIGIYKAAIGKDDMIGQLIWDWRELENYLGTKTLFQIKTTSSKGEKKVHGTVAIGFGVKRAR